MNNAEVTLSVPRWLTTEAASLSSCLDTPERKMRFVINLSRRNVEHRTGGPFAAAVFDLEGNKLISCAVNRVVPLSCSIAHAEIIAIAIAQKKLSTHDLGSLAGKRYELVSSTEPCAMCLGAVPWAGVQSLVCGATAEDAGKIGFDEGAKPSDWIRQLNQRGVTVTREVCRSAAVDVLNSYLRSGGRIYNSAVNASLS